MHRRTVSLLAFFQALFLLHGEGFAADGNGKEQHAPSDAQGKKTANGVAEEKKSGATGPSVKKTDATRSKVVETVAATKKSASAAGEKNTAAKGAPAGKKESEWPKAKPGNVRLVRGSESTELRVLDRKQRVVPATLPQFAKFLRSKGGFDHPIDARLVTLVATVSDHFGGREVNVVSGFRP
ncbi:MAG: hypothetical protein ABW133_07505 [Polyangiaceae bacterium]